MLSVVFVVNTSLKCLKLNQNTYTSHTCAYDQFEHLLARAFIDAHLAQHHLEHFLDSDWYTPEAHAFFSISYSLLHFCFFLGWFFCQGGVFFSTLSVHDKFTCEQGGEILRFPDSSI
jgi:hypothetical protein